MVDPRLDGGEQRREAGRVEAPGRQRPAEGLQVGVDHVLQPADGLAVPPRPLRPLGRVEPQQRRQPRDRWEFQPAAGLGERPGPVPLEGPTLRLEELQGDARRRLGRRSRPTDLVDDFGERERVAVLEVRLVLQERHREPRADAHELVLVASAGRDRHP